MYIELESVFSNIGEIKEFDYSFAIDDDTVCSPVKVKGRIVNKSGIVSMNAVVVYDVSAPCALCMTQINRTVTVPIEHTLLSCLENEEDFDLYIVVENMRLDLDELIREDVFLAMPMRFLCKEDCKGLCGICGTDLNTGTCSCKKPVDSRWAALSDLLENN